VISQKVELALKSVKFFSPDTELVFDLYMGDEVIRVEGLVARVTPILSGIDSIMSIKFSGRTDHIKHKYLQMLNRHRQFDKTI
jgi:hypothetical protein